MELKAYVPDPLNEQASVLVDAQTDIKTAIKKGVLGGASFIVISAEVRKIISRTIARIRSPTLQKDARVSLMKFANKAYSDFQATLNLNGTLLAAAVLLSERITERKVNGIQTKYFVPKTPREIDAVEQVAESTEIRLRAYDRGLPLQEFQKTYIDRVSRALGGLAAEKALDPNDVTGRNSLRNLAEMQVRYERHQDEISQLKASGNRLVVCSVHADCSERCAPFQGRVYSLDGTSGTTEDGKPFVPLETATDIYYTTKAGRTYKNGLLGFNCRHKLMPYKAGMVIPFVSEAERKKEDAITKRQREMERAVIHYREEALAYKGENAQRYKEAKGNALKMYDAYKRFSKDNGRAYYPDRVKIL